MSTDSMSAQHPTKTPEYWLQLARTERAFAAADQRRRQGSVESIDLHIKQAERYEQQAAKLSQVGSDLWLDDLRQELGTGVHRDLFNRIARAALAKATGIADPMDQAIVDNGGRFTL